MCVSQLLDERMQDLGAIAGILRIGIPAAEHIKLTGEVVKPGLGGKWIPVDRTGLRAEIEVLRRLPDIRDPKFHELIIGCVFATAGYITPPAIRPGGITIQFLQLFHRKAIAWRIYYDNGILTAAILIDSVIRNVEGADMDGRIIVIAIENIGNPTSRLVAKLIPIRLASIAILVVIGEIPGLPFSTGII